MTNRNVFGLRRETVLDVYIMASGLFLLASPWMFRFAERSDRIEAEIIGAALVALSAAAVIAFAKWEEWINVALGVWLIAAPWVLGFQRTATHISVGIGIIVAYLALLELWLIHDARTGNG